MWKNKEVYAIVVLTIDRVLEGKERQNYAGCHQFDILASGHPVLYRADHGKFYIGGKEKPGLCAAFRVFRHVGDL
jgi:hypothetical protein